MFVTIIGEFVGQFKLNLARGLHKPVCGTDSNVEEYLKCN